MHRSPIWLYARKWHTPIRRASTSVSLQTEDERLTLSLGESNQIKFPLQILSNHSSFSIFPTQHIFLPNLGQRFESLTRVIGDCLLPPTQYLHHCRPKKKGKKKSTPLQAKKGPKNVSTPLQAKKHKKTLMIFMQQILALLYQLQYQRDLYAMIICRSISTSPMTSLFFSSKDIQCRVSTSTVYPTLDCSLGTSRLSRFQLAKKRCLLL